jgi:hypothetical protein
MKIVCTTYEIQSLQLLVGSKRKQWVHAALTFSYSSRKEALSALKSKRKQFPKVRHRLVKTVTTITEVVQDV